MLLKNTFLKKTLLKKTLQKKPLLKKTPLPIFHLPLLLALCAPASSNTHAEAPAWHFDADASQRHQVFEDSSADLRSLTLIPSLAWNNWQLSLSLPWQSIEGEYFVNNHQASPKLLCQRYANLTPARQLRWRQRGRISTEQLADCPQQASAATASDKVSGLSDAELFANYVLPLDDIWLLNGGLGYKWDNGDVAQGLGTGTRELRLELGVSANWNAFTASLTGGQTQVDNTAPEQEVASHYSDIHADLRYQISDKWIANGGLHRQTALYPGADAPGWLSLGINYSPWSTITLHAGVNHYASSVDYPQQEWRIGVSYGI